MKSTKQLVLSAGAAALVLVFAWYQFVWSHQTASIAKADKAMTKSAAAAKSLQQRFTQLQSEKVEQPTRSSLLDQINAAIPSDPKLVDYMRLINAVADKNEVKLTASQHTEPAASAAATAPAPATTAPSSSGSAASTATTVAPDGGLVKTALTLTVQGTYDHVLSFVHALDTQTRLIVVDSISLSGGAAAPSSSDGGASPTTSPADAGLTASITAHILSTGGVDALPQGATS